MRATSTSGARIALVLPHGRAVTPLEGCLVLLGENSRHGIGWELSAPGVAKDRQ